MPPALWLAGVLGPLQRDRTVVRWLAEPDRLVPMPTGIRWNAISLVAATALPLLDAALDGPCAQRIGPVLHDARTGQTYWLIPPDQAPDWVTLHPQAHLLLAGHLLDIPDPGRTLEPDSPRVRWVHWPEVNGTLTSPQWLRSALLAPEDLDRHTPAAASTGSPTTPGRSPPAVPPDRPAAATTRTGAGCRYPVGASEVDGIIRAVDLRAELIPPLVSQQRLDELLSAISRIAELVLFGAGSADDEIRAFNTKTGHDYVALDFAEYDGSRSLSEFALEAARPARPWIANITTEELVEIVRRILAGDPESDYYLRLFAANVSHPRVSGLIFHPPAELRDASAEEVVHTALNYRPIAL